MTVVDDTRKGTTYGDPDGPERFIDTLGCSVPTFINPRLDLIPDVRGRDKAFLRIDYHVPFQLRGDFKLGQWPKEIQMRYGATTRTDIEGHVLCAGINKGSRSGQRSSEPGSLCKKRARNRTLFCEVHGGGLHPADKKMTSMSVQTIPQDRVERLNRVQKFMQGFITAEELDDDEIQGGFVRNEEGVAVHGYKLGAKFQAILAKEMHRRLNDFLKSNTSDMLKVMVSIARNDMYEAADRIKAAQWVAEKTMERHQMFWLRVRRMLLILLFWSLSKPVVEKAIDKLLKAAVAGMQKQTFRMKSLTLRLQRITNSLKRKRILREAKTNDRMSWWTTTPKFSYTPGQYKTPEKPNLQELRRYAKLSREGLRQELQGRRA